MHSALEIAGLGVAALLAGAINSVAGGGSLLSFPALVAFGMPPAIANATNNAAVWPGTVSSAYAYRHDFPTDRALSGSLILSSVLGGTLGAAIMVGTPPALFQVLTPFLVLFGTTVFAGREFFSRLIRNMRERHDTPTLFGRIAGFIFQFLVATYGGYFGAGAGIIMLGALGLMGITDIHRMNAMKTLLACTFNGIAFICFAVAGMVVWPVALAMGACSILGGYAGARMAKRVDHRMVGMMVIFLGYSAALWLFLKNI